MINRTAEIVCREFAVSASALSDKRYRTSGTMKVNERQNQNIEQKGTVFSQHTGTLKSFLVPGVSAVMST